MFKERPPRSERRAHEWQLAARHAYRETPAGPLACRQGFVITHEQARTVGISAARARALVRRGQWTAPRRDALCVLPRDRSAAIHGELPEIRAAAVALLRNGAVISHECAALVHGLDVLRVPDAATLTTSLRSRAVCGPGAVVRAAHLESAEVTTWYGVLVTTIARTVIDIARHSARDGIVVADSARHEGLATPVELRRALGRAAGWGGIRTARGVVELASAWSESALESLTRLFLADHGVPLPEQQVWIGTHRGRFRVDGVWPAQRVILECDGLGKYRAGDDALVLEKLREEALRRAGYDVVRVTWAELHYEAAETLARICRALGLHPVMTTNCAKSW